MAEHAFLEFVTEGNDIFHESSDIADVSCYIETTGVTKKRVKCEQCEKMFRCRSEMLAHMKSHSEAGPRVCVVCFNSFSSARSLRIHYKRIHVNGFLHPCDACQKVFYRKGDLAKHLKCHISERPHQCLKCCKSYVKKEELEQHLQDHPFLPNAPKKHRYQCNICQKTFAMKWYLNNHMTVHGQGKPFQCGVCQKVFACDTGLLYHMRIHSGVKPYKCDICSRQFRESSSLASHKKLHTGLKPFKCPNCEKTFATKQQVRSHNRVHTGEKPFPCDFCDKAFSSSSVRAVHRRTHTGEKPYLCLKCSKSFPSYAKMASHYRVHLKEKKAEVCSTARTDTEDAVSDGNVSTDMESAVTGGNANIDTESAITGGNISTDTESAVTGASASSTGTKTAIENLGTDTKSTRCKNGDGADSTHKPNYVNTEEVTSEFAEELRLLRESMKKKKKRSRWDLPETATENAEADQVVVNVKKTVKPCTVSKKAKQSKVSKKTESSKISKKAEELKVRQGRPIKPIDIPPPAPPKRRKFNIFIIPIRKVPAQT